MKRKAYFDNAATTWLDPKVEEAMQLATQSRFGNPSSLHSLGVRANALVEMARMTIAESIGGKPDEIVFTSGGTESNNLAIKGYAYANRTRGRHLVVSAIEHSSVLDVVRWLETQGFSVSYVPVDRDGRVTAEAFRASLRPDTILASVMHANNEVGVIQDLSELGAICRERGIAFHTDACQSYTKLSLNVGSGLDLVSLNAHKIHGPKGVGALYVREGTNLEALFHGGGHERKLRSGTLNVEGIVGFAHSVMVSDQSHVRAMAEMSERLIARVLNSIPEARLNGPRLDRLCSNANFTFDGCNGKKILFDLDKLGFQVSTGSACASGAKKPSHVLTAMGRSFDEAAESVRISLSRWTTDEETEGLVNALCEVIGAQKDLHARSA